MKPPWVEDYQYCYEKNTHTFVKCHDKIIRCLYCNKTLEEIKLKKKEE